MSYKSARSFIRLLVRLIAVLEVEDVENMPLTGAFIGVSNHLGRLDAILPYCFVNRTDVVMMVAEKYRENRFFDWFVKQLNGFYIDRFNADWSAMRIAIQELKKGCVLVVAPEGTRSPTGALIEARAGGSYLAAKTGTPILPVGVTGTEDKNVVAHLKHLRRVPVHAKVGKLFTLPPLPAEDREAALQRYTDEIMCHIAMLLPPKYWGFYADHPRLKELLAG